MGIVRPTLLALIAAAFLGLVAGATGAGAVNNTYNCSGGSIPAGNYSALFVKGPCTLDAGNVNVDNNVWVLQGGSLIAAFGGSDLHVGGSISVLANGILVLGCEPEAFPCLNDPDQTVGTMSTNHVIGRNIDAMTPLAVITHNNTIGGNVTEVGGGGGLNCDSRAQLQGAPAYSVYEDSTIGGHVTISNMRTCWLGFFRNRVAGGVTYMSNSTADPDGNEIATNTIDRKLICFGNSPAPQFGDSGGDPNTVTMGAVGQCAGVTP